MQRVKWHKRECFLNTWAKQSVFKNEGKSHHMKYYTHFTVVVLCDGFHLPPWDFPNWNLQTVFEKKRNGIQTEFGVLALWLWIQAYSWHLAIPSNALANAYAKNPYNKKMQPSCASDVNLCEASNVT